MDFNTALANSESGGRYDAYRKNKPKPGQKEGEEFFGKYQFGIKRLTDLGLGQDFTLEQFINDPELQEMVQQRHLNDIDEYIDNNDLARFEGTTINGTPLTREGMYAIAHLGGNKGMRDYLLSGGEYNPADELGTRLSAYAANFSGGPTRAIAGETPRSAAPEVGRSDEDNPLMRFASAIDESNDLLTQSLDRQAEMINNQNQSMLTFGQPSAQQTPFDRIGSPGQLRMPPQMGPQLPNQVASTPFDAVTQGSPLSFGAPAQPNTPSTPAAGGNATFSGGPTSGDVSLSTATTEEQPQTVPDRILAALMPNRSPEERREVAGDVLGMLSRGLGQMSAGQAVDLSSNFQRMAARQEAVANRGKDALEQQLQARRLLMDERRLELDEYKQDMEVAKLTLANTPGGGLFSEQQIAAYAADPDTAAFIPMITSSDEETRKQGVQGLRSVLNERAKAGLTEGANSDAFVDALNTWSDPSTSTRERNEALRGLSADQLKEFRQYPGIDPTAFQQDSQAYKDALKNDLPLARAMEQMRRSDLGIDETPKERANREGAEKKIERLQEPVNTNAALYSELLRMEDLTYKLMEGNVETGTFNKAITTLGDGLRQVIGSDAVASGLDALGLPRSMLSDIAQLEASEQALALMIAGPLMEGGGQISDGERKSMMEIVANGNTSAATRLEMIARLKAIHKLDQVVARQYRAGLNEDNSNQSNLFYSIQEDARSVLPEIRKASIASVGIKNKDRLNEFDYYNDMTLKERVIKMSPILTPAQYELFKDALPVNYKSAEDTTGARFWARRNADGTITYMINDQEQDL